MSLSRAAAALDQINDVAPQAWQELSSSDEDHVEDKRISRNIISKALIHDQCCYSPVPGNEEFESNCYAENLNSSLSSSTEYPSSGSNDSDAVPHDSSYAVPNSSINASEFSDSSDSCSIHHGNVLKNTSKANKYLHISYKLQSAQLDNNLSIDSFNDSKQSYDFNQPKAGCFKSIHTAAFSETGSNFSRSSFTSNYINNSYDNFDFKTNSESGVIGSKHNLNSFLLPSPSRSTFFTDTLEIPKFSYSDSLPEGHFGYCLTDLNKNTSSLESRDFVNLYSIDNNYCKNISSIDNFNEENHSVDFERRVSFDFNATSSAIPEDYNYDLTTNFRLKSDPFTPLDPKKYRTELCRPFQVHGYCKYGISRCNYAHGLSQLKVSFHHGKYKTRNCESYHNTGSCRYGARCSFIHDPEEGIMKCAITDREILEALHCHPADSYIASITWRIMNPLYPPTELYFFSPSYREPILPFDNAVVKKNCKVDASNDKPKVLNTIDPVNAAKQVHCASNAKDEIVKEFNSQKETVASTHMAASPPCSAPKKVYYDDPNPLNTNGSHYAKKKSYPKEVTPIERRAENAYDFKMQNRRSDRSKTVTNFRLDDFLRCLKTRGQQHLSSWAPDRLKIAPSTDRELVHKRQRSDHYSVEYSRDRDFRKYKTELCRSYQYNKYCEYGDNCLYAHGIKDLRSYPKHPMYRTKKCFSFHQKGFCLYGSRCQFLHDIE